MFFYLWQCSWPFALHYPFWALILYWLIALMMVIWFNLLQTFTSRKTHLPLPRYRYLFSLQGKTGWLLIDQARTNQPSPLLALPHHFNFDVFICLFKTTFLPLLFKFTLLFTTRKFIIIFFLALRPEIFCRGIRVVPIFLIHYDINLILKIIFIFC